MPMTLEQIEREIANLSADDRSALIKNLEAKLALHQREKSLRGMIDAGTATDADFEEAKKIWERE